MWGAIVGDVVGSIYEHAELKGYTLPLISAASHFTDDTVLTVATADALLEGNLDFAGAYLRWGNRYRKAGFSGGFDNWLLMGGQYPYGSMGNGAAMRVSPISWLYDVEEQVANTAAMAAMCTHDHPGGAKGAQAAALAVLYARQGLERDVIRRKLGERFNYDLAMDLDELHRDYQFTTVAKWSVPHAIQIALDSKSFEDCMHLGLYIGGDTDTILAIAGSIAEALYPNQIPVDLKKYAKIYIKKWAPDMLPVIAKFELRKPYMKYR